jgi:hypothetical protein
VSKLTLGPHLLGRLPTTPDPRDFTIAMVKDASPLDLAYQHLMVSHAAKATKEWATAAMPILEPGWTPTPAPSPTPTPTPTPTTDVHWADPDKVLDQGNTGHCGGFGGCQWGNTLPVDDAYTNADGDALYYEAVSIGGAPGSENGVESRWVAQALQARKRLSTYAFAKTTDEVTDWLRTKGPVMVGTDWTNDMFQPTSDGYIVPTGGVAGGHFWVLTDHYPDAQAYGMLNSWSDSWGAKGRAEIYISDFEKLLKGLSYPGDAIVSPELAA